MQSCFANFRSESASDLVSTSTWQKQCDFSLTSHKYQRIKQPVTFFCKHKIQIQSACSKKKTSSDAVGGSRNLRSKKIIKQNPVHAHRAPLQRATRKRKYNCVWKYLKAFRGKGITAKCQIFFGPLDTCLFRVDSLHYSRKLATAVQLHPSILQLCM